MRTALSAATLLASVLLVGCSAVADANAPHSTASPGGTPAAPKAAGDQDPNTSEAAGGPETAFRAWLAASRAPEPAVACGYLAERLAERMVDEMIAQGWPGVDDCASMIVATAELYAAVGDSPDVSIEVREEDRDTAELFVRYADGGDCGTASMRRVAASWIITEQSQEEC
jgi:hypothetical protein